MTRWPRAGWLWLVLALLALASGLTACGAILGIDDGTPEPDGGATSHDATSPGHHPDSAAHDAPGSKADGHHPGKDAPSGHETGTASEGGGDGNLAIDGGPDAGDAGGQGDAAGDADLTVVYVSAEAGTDDDTCGRTTAPCKTIQHGIVRAAIARAPQVDVAAGTYNESVALASGVDVQGGYDSAWNATNDAGITVIQGVKNPAVAANNLTIDTTVSTVTILSKLAGIGESVTAVTVHGTLDAGAEGGTLTLQEVVVKASSAGDGGMGAAPAAPTPAPASCSDGNAGQGTSGSNGETHAGSFGENGYTPGNGDPGTPGQPGGNGMSGSQSCTSNNCINGCGNFFCGDIKIPADVCAAGGPPGCGGGGGGGGGGGPGGGSSVAVYVWNASVIISGGFLQSGNGGNGAHGVNGADGAGGSASKAGPTVTCTSAVSSCTSNSCETTAMLSATGNAGSAGGAGGTGGNGAGGSGGSSYVVFYNSPTFVSLVNNPVLIAGTAGVGWNGAPSGASANQGSP